MDEADLNTPVEFALDHDSSTVRLRTVRTRNGIRLEVSSPRTCRITRLDPVILESLTWQTPETFRGMMDASDRPKAPPQENAQPKVESLQLPEQEEAAAARAKADAAMAEAVLSNEFATVYIRRVDSFLEISSPRAQYGVRLDPVALESLVWQTPETLSVLMETPFGPEGHEA